METVSIIITAYNYEQFVAQAIDSALNQTYPQVEVIVVNDGSTDGTARIIKTYGHRITSIEQANAGVVAARNAGAARAKGHYILFLDADDYLPAEFIAHCLKILKQHPEAAFVYADRQVIGTDTFLYRSRPWDADLLLLTNYIGLTSLITMTAWRRIGGFRPVLNRVKSYEDWDLWLSLAAAGYRGVYTDQTYYFHRKLYAGSRNDASLWLKLRLRWPILLIHHRQYGSWSFLKRLPLIAWLAIKNKLNFLAARRPD
jgi:glycosyltransferase involved in cell wall biosynthesis